MKKRIVSIVLVVMMGIALVACAREKKTIEETEITTELASEITKNTETKAENMTCVISLQSAVEDKTIKLSWEEIKDFPYESVEIEKSSDGTTFENVQSILKGTNECIIADLDYGTYYFRARVCKDKSKNAYEEFSGVITVTTTAPETSKLEDTTASNGNNGNGTSSGTDSNASSNQTQVETTYETTTVTVEPQAPAILDPTAASATGITVDYGKTPQCISQINTLRGSVGADSLTEDSTLDAIAQARAVDMASKGYYSHYYRDSNKAEYLFLMEDYGIVDRPYSGENVHKIAEKRAQGKVVDLAMQEWINSPGHYSNLVNPNYWYIGVGFAYCPSDGYWYCVQIFTGPTDEEWSAVYGGF